MYIGVQFDLDWIGFYYGIWNLIQSNKKIGFWLFRYLIQLLQFPLDLIDYEHPYNLYSQA